MVLMFLRKNHHFAIYHRRTIDTNKRIIVKCLNPLRKLVNKLASEKWDRYRGSPVDVATDHYRYIDEYTHKKSQNYKNKLII